jgi:hypothetical protein
MLRGELRRKALSAGFMFSTLLVVMRILKTARSPCPAYELTCLYINYFEVISAYFILLQQHYRSP